jgi:DNA recombination-dependent growth factor C
VAVPWEYGGDLEVETAMARLDADLALVVLSLRRLFEVLFPAFGGRAVE